MTEHMSQIQFERDSRGIITGYKSHSISSEILDKIDAMEYGLIRNNIIGYFLPITKTLIIRKNWNE